MTAATPARQRTKSRAQLVLLALLFFGPLAAAFVVYYGFPNLRPPLSSAHGTLISPARPLPEVTLNGADGQAQPAVFVQRRWSLVWVGPGDCDNRCGDALAAMRVVHELLSEDASRVQRVYLYTGAPPVLAPADAPALRALSLEGAAGEALLAPFPAPAAGRIYIVDPHGNLMMSYALDGDVRKGLLTDLRRLLKYSHIG